MNIRNFLVKLFLLLTICSGLFGYQVSASDDIEWDDLDLQYAEYFEDNEELKLKFIVEDVNEEPDEYYFMQFDLEGEDCDEAFYYDSDESLLYVECNVDIDEDDIEDDYEIDYVIIDEDNDEQLDDTIDIDVVFAEDIDWDDISVEKAEYSEEEEELTILIYVEDIEDEPNLDYEMILDFDWDDYVIEFDYDSDEEVLFAEFIIEVGKYEVEEDYELDYLILDEYWYKLEDDEIEFDVESIENIDWDNISVEKAEYDEEEEELTILVYIEGIEEEPSEDYEMVLDFDWDDYDEDLDYDEDEELLYVEFVIDVDEDDIEEDYELDYEILNEDGEELSDDSIEFDIEFIESIDLSDVNVKLSEYDEDEEELTILIYIEGIEEEPSEDYEMVLDFDWDDYDEDLDYDEDEELLYVEFVIDVDEDDIEEDYELDYEILDEEEDEVADGSIEFEVWEWNSEFDWENLSVEYVEYDEDEEELTISVYVEWVDEEPSEDYEMILEFDWEEYDEEFEYNSDDKILLVKFVLNIDEDNIEEDYKLDYIIIEEDEVADGSIEFELWEWSSESDNVSSSDLEYESINIYSHSYDDDDEILSILVYVNGVEDEPEESYKMKLKFDWSYYENSLTYNSYKERLYVKFSIDVEEDDLEDTYKLPYSILDKNDDKLFSDSLSLAMNEDLDWKTMKIKSWIYDEETWKLTFSVYLNNIDDKPFYDYIAKIDWDLWTIEKTFEYDDDILMAEFTIDLNKDDVEDSYDLSILVISENLHQELTWEFTIKVKFNLKKVVEKPIKYITLWEDLDDEREQEIVPQIVTAINSFIERVAKAKKTNAKIIVRLETMVDHLNKLATQNPKYASIVADMNYLINKAISKYEAFEEEE